MTTRRSPQSASHSVRRRSAAIRLQSTVTGKSITIIIMFVPDTTSPTARARAGRDHILDDDTPQLDTSATVTWPAISALLGMQATRTTDDSDSLS